MVYTPDQLILQEFLENKRRQARSWVHEDPVNRKALTPTTDLDYWSSHNVMSINDYDKYLTECAIIEYFNTAKNMRLTHKDMHGLNYNSLIEFFNMVKKGDIDIDTCNEAISVDVIIRKLSIVD
jgi:hypothetical protein